MGSARNHTVPPVAAQRFGVVVPGSVASTFPGRTSIQTIHAIVAMTLAGHGGPHDDRSSLDERTNDEQ
jgi:hypothetical protein